MNKIKLLEASLTLSVMAIAQSYEGSINLKWKHLRIQLLTWTT